MLARALERPEETSDRLARPAGLTQFSLCPGDEKQRRALRAFLASQFSFESAQRTREDLSFVLGSAGALVWALAMWPGIFPAVISSTLLGSWAVLFLATLYVRFLEWLWWRRSKRARVDLSSKGTATR
jgi:hypothetical protein